MNPGMFWKGKPIEEMSKEELIAVIEHLSFCLERGRAEHQANLRSIG